MAAHKGSIPWNKGKTVDRTMFPTMGHFSKHTEETKLAISTNRKGKTVKEKNPAWKGGLRSQNYIERRKFQKTIQKKVLERDNYTCQLCGQYGGILHVDHIQPFAEYLEGRFDLDNCRTLCRECHYFITFKKVMPQDSKWGRTFIH